MLDWLRTLWIQSQLGRSGRYVEANGALIYYETYGRGEPLLMFHGGLSTLLTFRKQIPELSKYYQVILPERPGHGHTKDREGDFHYQDMARDMASFVKALGLKAPCKMIGYSDGANLLFHLAMDYPHLVDRFVSIGGNFHYEGCTPEFQEEVRNLPKGGITEEGVDEKYVKYSPDGPSHYSVVFEKTRKLWLEEPTLRKEDLRQINAAALILAGDHEMFRPEHTIALYEALLPKAELFVVSNATHHVPKEYPRIVNKTILDFLKRNFEEDVGARSPRPFC